MGNVTYLYELFCLVYVCFVVSVPTNNVMLLLKNGLGLNLVLQIQTEKFWKWKFLIHISQCQLSLYMKVDIFVHV
jgi:hypothetical protein